MNTSTPPSATNWPSWPPLARVALLVRLKEMVALQGEGRLGEYAGQPVEYAEKKLGITTLTPEQKEMLRLLHVPPCRVLVPSAHDVGKTFCAAVAVSYWFDSFDPGIVISTAPTDRDVKDLLWTEVRLQRQRAGLSMPFIGPSAPHMRTSEEHYA